MKELSLLLPLPLRMIIPTSLRKSINSLPWELGAALSRMALSGRGVVSELGSISNRDPTRALKSPQIQTTPVSWYFETWYLKVLKNSNEMSPLDELLGGR